MIAFLEGTIAHISPNSIIINVGGVGYKVFVTPKTLGLPLGSAIILYTYHKSSDDGQALYGFPEPATLDFFELLLTVSGVGPKIALAILSAGDPETLRAAIAGQDTGLFSHIGGVGKKTAERIIVELKDKVGIASTLVSGSASNDLFTALIGLGYTAAEARQTVSLIDLTVPVEQQLKQALKLLSR